MSQERDEVLISHVIDGQATPGEWDELLAVENPGLWRQLAETLRGQAGVTRAVNAAGAVAEAIDLPVNETRPQTVPASGGLPGAWRRLGSWSGWAVAAAVAIAWAFGLFGPERRAVPGDTPEIARAGTAAELLAAYLNKGRQEESVLGEVPQQILIDSRPAASGEGYELLYLRQILERAVVPDLYQFTGQDELGRPTLVRFDQTPGPSM
ncbi:MAG: hypothetical protein ACYS0G_11675 [Planctomycetota bacterium]|jgi:hypothetical protein